MTDFHMQLLEKQKLKAMYAMRERQLLRFLEKAQRMPGLTGENLLVLLERRLDTVVRRLGFAVTSHQARQLVSHGHILINGRRVDVPSYLVEPGSEIAVVDKELIHVREAVLQTPDVPPYMERDADLFKGRLVRLPERDEIPHPVEIDERLVVEFYAR